MSRQGEKRTRTLANVKDFWNKEAQQWGENPRVTIRDHYFRLLEIDTVLPIIKGRDKILDIGCGTGFSSIFYAQVVNKIIGADYAELMVERAMPNCFAARVRFPWCKKRAFLIISSSCFPISLSRSSLNCNGVV